jgi:hypothetical protein
MLCCSPIRERRYTPGCNFAANLDIIEWQVMNADRAALLAYYQPHQLLQQRQKQLIPQLTLSVMPDEMRVEIFEKLVEMRDWETLKNACQVNWQWNTDIEKLWRKYCARNNMLEDEQLWAKKGKSWRWLCDCLSKVVEIKEEQQPQQQQQSNAGDSNSPAEQQQQQQSPDVFETGYAMLPAPENQKCKYEGEWKNSKRQGVGKISWYNGDCYLGDWRNDAKHGHGFMRWSNGDFYDGPWNTDMRHGSGVQYQYHNGGKFVGEYVHDERHGAGRFIWPDGDVFEGVWQFGGRRGNGVLILKDGTRIEQVWHENAATNYSERLPDKYPVSPAQQQQNQFANFPPHNN